VIAIHQESFKPPTVGSLSPIRHEPTTPYGKEATKMSELSTAIVEPVDVGHGLDQSPQDWVVGESAPPRAEALPPPAIFITGHEVVFSAGGYLGDSRVECERHRQ
jgi:hypothetical protein